jgi:hypothetical protein
VGPRNAKRVACNRHRDGESRVYARHGCACYHRKGFGPGGGAAPPYQRALRMHGFENAGRAEGANGQSTDK